MRLLLKKKHRETLGTKECSILDNALPRSYTKLRLLAVVVVLYNITIFKTILIAFSIAFFKIFTYGNCILLIHTHGVKTNKITPLLLKTRNTLW